MRVKYLAQEHNAVPRPGLEPGPPDPESCALTIRPPRLPREMSIEIFCTISSNVTFLYNTQFYLLATCYKTKVNIFLGEQKKKQTCITWKVDRA